MIPTWSYTNIFTILSILFTLALLYQEKKLWILVIAKISLMKKISL